MRFRQSTKCVCAVAYENSSLSFGLLIGKLGLLLKMVSTTKFMVSSRGMLVKRLCTSKDMRARLQNPGPIL